jgi:hypothetical protein
MLSQTGPAKAPDKVLAAHEREKNHPRQRNQHFAKEIVSLARREVVGGGGRNPTPKSADMVMLA